MGSAVYKQRYVSISETDAIARNAAHLLYIATRPGAIYNPCCGFGLWGSIEERADISNINNLENAKRIVKETSKAHTIYRGVVSLEHKDAMKHGYYEREAWQKLICEKIDVIRKEMDIDSKDFRWCASYHHEKEHPHIHIMFWDSSDKIRNEFIPDERFEIMSEKIRAEFNREIFHDEIRNLQQAQGEVFAKLKEDFEKELKAFMPGIKVNMDFNDTAEPQEEKREVGQEVLAIRYISEEKLLQFCERMIEIEETLPKKGAFKYAYLPTDAKTALDNFTDELLQTDAFSKLKREYLQIARNVAEQYGNGEESVAHFATKAEDKLYNVLGNQIINYMKQNDISAMMSDEKLNDALEFGERRFLETGDIMDEKVSTAGLKNNFEDLENRRAFKDSINAALTKDEILSFNQEDLENLSKENIDKIKEEKFLYVVGAINKKVDTEKLQECFNADSRAILSAVNPYDCFGKLLQLNTKAIMKDKEVTTTLKDYQTSIKEFITVDMKEKTFIKNVQRYIAFKSKQDCFCAVTAKNAEAYYDAMAWGKTAHVIAEKIYDSLSKEVLEKLLIDLPDKVEDKTSKVALNESNKFSTKVRQKKLTANEFVEALEISTDRVFKNKDVRDVTGAYMTCIEKYGKYVELTGELKSDILKSIENKGKVCENQEITVDEIVGYQKNMEYRKIAARVNDILHEALNRETAQDYSNSLCESAKEKAESMLSADNGTVSKTFREIIAALKQTEDDVLINESSKALDKMLNLMLEDNELKAYVHEYTKLDVIAVDRSEIDENKIRDYYMQKGEMQIDHKLTDSQIKTFLRTKSYGKMLAVLRNVVLNEMPSEFISKISLQTESAFMDSLIEKVEVQKEEIFTKTDSSLLAKAEDILKSVDDILGNDDIKSKMYNYFNYILVSLAKADLNDIDKERILKRKGENVSEITKADKIDYFRTQLYEKAKNDILQNFISNFSENEIDKIEKAYSSSVLDSLQHSLRDAGTELGETYEKLLAVMPKRLTPAKEWMNDENKNLFYECCDKAMKIEPLRTQIKKFVDFKRATFKFTGTDEQKTEIADYFNNKKDNAFKTVEVDSVDKKLAEKYALSKAFSELYKECSSLIYNQAKEDKGWVAQERCNLAVCGIMQLFRGFEKDMRNERGHLPALFQNEKSKQAKKEVSLRLKNKGLDWGDEH